jgi:hypothetical protein
MELVKEMSNFKDSLVTHCFFVTRSMNLRLNLVKELNCFLKSADLGLLKLILKLRYFRQYQDMKNKSHYLLSTYILMISFLNLLVTEAFI